MRMSQLAISTCLGVSVALTACGTGITGPSLNPQSPSFSEAREPDSITITAGEGATFNGGGRTNGTPPPEIVVVRPDGSTIFPAR